jgi:predicted N-acyltransferase
LLDAIKKKLQSIRLRCSESDEKSTFDIALFSTVDDIPFEHWNKVLNKEKLPLTIPYLAAVEVKPARNMSFHYAIVYKDIVPVAVLYFQEFDFSLANISRNVNVARIESILNGLKKLAGVSVNGSEGVAARLLVFGNTYTTGEYGFHYTTDFHKEKLSDIIVMATDKIIAGQKKSGKINAILLKDFYKTRDQQLLGIKNNSFHVFNVQPSMELTIQPEWKTFEDYLAAFSSKYRVRAKSALKKGLRLTQREFTADDISAHYEKIMQLYTNVEEKADFQLVTISKTYFYDLKIALENNFVFKAFFLEGELVAFVTLLHGNDCLEANFVGMNYDYNLENCIYQNILYDDVKMAIERKVKVLYFGRTALEIKSTLGAEPLDMFLFVKHTNSITNSILGTVMANLKQAEWIQRRPFKDVEEKVEG